MYSNNFGSAFPLYILHPQTGQPIPNPALQSPFPNPFPPAPFSPSPAAVAAAAAAATVGNPLAIPQILSQMPRLTPIPFGLHNSGTPSPVTPASSGTDHEVASVGPSSSGPLSAGQPPTTVAVATSSPRPQTRSPKAKKKRKKKSKEEKAGTSNEVAIAVVSREQAGPSTSRGAGPSGSGRRRNQDQQNSMMLLHHMSDMALKLHSLVITIYYILI